MSLRSDRIGVAFIIAASMVSSIGSLSLFSSATYEYAQGSTAEIPFLYKECQTPADDPGSPVRFRFADRTAFEAASPGKVNLRCKDETLTLVVTRASRLSVKLWRDEWETSKRVPAGSLVELFPEAFSASGSELLIGGSSRVQWEFSGVLRAERRQCSGEGIFRYCPPDSHGVARAIAAGRGQALARFAGLEARLVLEVKPRQGGRPATAPAR